MSVVNEWILFYYSYLMYISVIRNFLYWCNEIFRLIKFYQMNLSPIKREVEYLSKETKLSNIPLSSQFSSSNIQKKRRKQKLYKRENHINLASINFRRDHLYHERVLDIRVKHNFFESWFIYPMEPTDPRNDRCSPIHKQLPVPGWIEIHPIIGEFDGL